MTPQISLSRRATSPTTYFQYSTIRRKPVRSQQLSFERFRNVDNDTDCLQVISVDRGPQHESRRHPEQGPHQESQSESQHEPQGESVESKLLPQQLDEQQTSYPPYDTCSSTRNLCVITTCVGLVAGIACLFYGSFVVWRLDVDSSNYIPGTSYYFESSHAWPEVCSFLITTALTFCIDSMMYVHSVSLRWALYDEGRLEYNTNVRLFTHSKTSAPNKWYANYLALFCLILSFEASATMLFSDNLNSGSLWVDGVAVLGMGIGILGQAAIALWCLTPSRQRNIPTCSSNPLNVALAALHRGQCTLQPGRCMLSVHQRHQRPVTGAYPLERQGSIWKARSAARLIMAVLWVLAIMAIAWPITIFCIAERRGASGPFNWNEPLNVSGNGSENSLSLPIFSLSPAAQATVCVLFLCLVQSLQTLGLHGAELLVNVARDEATWRKAYIGKQRAAKGACVRTDPLLAAASSWENVTLFFAKSLVHWIIGQSMTQKTQYPRFYTYIFTIDIRYSRLVIYAVLASLLAVFATVLGLRRRNGCLPATMGHLPTLANLIDDWQTDSKGRLWWGDKSPVRLVDATGSTSTGPTSTGPVVRHAGTSSDKKLVGLVYEHFLYAG